MQNQIRSSLDSVLSAFAVMDGERTLQVAITDIGCTADICVPEEPTDADGGSAIHISLDLMPIGGWGPEPNAEQPVPFDSCGMETPGPCEAVEIAAQLNRSRNALFVLTRLRDAVGRAQSYITVTPAELVDAECILGPVLEYAGDRNPSLWGVQLIADACPY